jgi:hypothetical protein
MERYQGHYRGYLIEAEFDKRWLVRVKPTSPHLPILSFATFHSPPDANLLNAIEDARARVDAVLSLGESVSASQHAQGDGDGDHVS